MHDISPSPARQRTWPPSTVATRLVPLASDAMLLQLRFVVPGTCTSPLGATTTVGAGEGAMVGLCVLPPLLPAAQV